MKRNETNKKKQTCWNDTLQSNEALFIPLSILFVTFSYHLTVTQLSEMWKTKHTIAHEQTV